MKHASSTSSVPDRAGLDQATESSDSDSGENMSSKAFVRKTDIKQVSANGDSDNNVKQNNKKVYSSARGIEVQSLKERSQIPPGMMIAAFSIFSCIYSSGFATNFFNDTIPILVRSVQHVNNDLSRRLRNTMDGGIASTYEVDGASGLSVCANITKLLVGTGVLCSIYYILLYKPLKAGMWGPTQRATRHVFHRYMGLLFIIQYSYAWYEFLTDYEGQGQFSYLPITIALNGIAQSISAYFSFKVLPNLNDAGYYSDKAVLSRNFVFENSFYQLLSVFGAVFYNDKLRTRMMSCGLGQFVIIVYCFFPYVFVRTWFPITRFKDAGTSMAGRTKVNEKFYKIGTNMVKFFYLWAKYFLGFFINWYVYLEKVSPEDMRLIRGLFLLNVGTVSISIFLHTLRFKKVLPGKLTFSIYLAQIYLTFSAIPSAYAMFSSHPRLGALTLSGLLLNMTRNRFIHFLWACACYVMIKTCNVDW